MCMYIKKFIMNVALTSPCTVRSLVETIVCEVVIRDHGIACAGASCHLSCH